MKNLYSTAMYWWPQVLTFAVLFLLKYADIIDLPWWCVTLPLWYDIALACLLLIVTGLIGVLADKPQKKTVT